MCGCFEMPLAIEIPKTNTIISALYKKLKISRAENKKLRRKISNMIRACKCKKPLHEKLLANDNNVLFFLLVSKPKNYSTNFTPLLNLLLGVDGLVCNLPLPNCCESFMLSPNEWVQKESWMEKMSFCCAWWDFTSVSLVKTYKVILMFQVQQFPGFFHHVVRGHMSFVCNNMLWAKTKFLSILWLVEMEKKYGVNFFYKWGPFT